MKNSFIILAEVADGGWLEGVEVGKTCPEVAELWDGLKLFITNSDLCYGSFVKMSFCTQADFVYDEVILDTCTYRK